MNIPVNLQPLVMYGEMSCKITVHCVVIWKQQQLLLIVNGALHLETER